MEKKNNRHGMPKKETYMAEYNDRNQAIARSLATKILQQQFGRKPSEPEIIALAQAKLMNIDELLAEAYQPENRKDVIMAAVAEANLTRAGKLYDYPTMAAYVEQRTAKAGKPISVQERNEILTPMYQSYDSLKETWKQFLQRCVTVINSRRAPGEKLFGTRRVANYFSNMTCYKKRRAAAQAREAQLQALTPGAKNIPSKAQVDQQVLEALEEKQRLEKQIELLKQQLLAAATPRIQNTHQVPVVEQQPNVNIQKVKQEIPFSVKVQPKTATEPEMDVGAIIREAAEQIQSQLAQA